MKIAVDAMGGDNVPSVVVKGAIEASQSIDAEIILVGQEKKIKQELKENFSNISIVHAPEIVEMHEQPSTVLRTKRNSSIGQAIQLLKAKKVDAVVSAGNTGATMAFSLIELGKLEGILRPAIASIMPTLTGECILLDVGANVDCKPNLLVQFAIMGNVYSKYIVGKTLPTIGLLSIGEESSKGNEQTLATYKMLQKTKLNFIGNVEGRDIVNGKTDVVLCDGFIGNIILKFAEGLSEMLFYLIDQELKNKSISEIDKDIFEDIKKRVDYAEYGGAPLLGTDGIVIISHGGSSSKAIMNAIRVASEFVSHQINQHIIEDIKSYQQEKYNAEITKS